jgi:hypothetical protein|tara:strand:- start:452 stop:865 length:414 start_codon:yes stop_codon:yes gene_type:complete
MALKNKSRIQHRTAKGKVVDMDMLRQRNELTPAVGNSRVNARGDEIGPGGVIVRTREEIIKEYYASTPSSVPDEVRAPKAKEAEMVTPEAKTTAVRSRAQKKLEDAPVNEPTAAELAEFEDSEWIEDADGNFIPKGE